MGGSRAGHEGDMGIATCVNLTLNLLSDRSE
jgi:hypothetical protein